MSLTVNHQTNDISNATGAILVNGVAVGGDNSPPAFVGSRSVFVGGQQENNSGDAESSNVIDYITISTPGNATDFGDMTSSRHLLAGLSNGTRGVMAGGLTGNSEQNTIDYITIATTGNATDFGDLTQAAGGSSGASGVTRGLIARGGNYNPTNVIEYITIATTGNSTDFGDATTNYYGASGTTDGDRGVFGALQSSGGSETNIMEYITIATTGNATDFGNLVRVGHRGASGNGDATYGILVGVNIYVTTINRITIQTTGNATDFGDLSVGRNRLAGFSGT